MKNTTVCTVCLYLRPKGFETRASGDGGCGEFGWDTLRNKWVEQLLFPEMDKYVGYLLHKRGGVNYTKRSSPFRRLMVREYVSYSVHR